VIANSRNLEEAAQVLGIDPATLYRKRKKMEPAEAEQSSSNA
jgi:DNA-binding NtrC family response regulator